MAKKSTQERALSNSDTFIPPHYFPARYFSTPPRKDMQRGELTQGKNITGAFTELRREAKAVQYRLLRNTIHEVLGSRQAAIEKAGLWPGFVTERDAMARDTYGDTLNRALRTWTLYTVRIATEEEARLTDERNGTPKDAGALVRYSRTWYGTHCEREGINDPGLTGLQRFRAEHCNLPDLHDAALVEYFDRHPLPTWFRMGTTEERRIVTGPEDAEIGDYAFVRPTQEVVPAVDQYARWNVEYTAEVEMCVEHFADSPDLGSELTGLIGALRSFEVSTGEGKAVVEHLRKTGVGSEVLTMMQHGKDRLLKRLEEIAKDITVETPNATTS